MVFARDVEANANTHVLATVMERILKDQLCSSKERNDQAAVQERREFNGI